MRSAIIALAMFAYLATLAPAAAHAMLVSSQPQDSQILPTSPREIVLGFNEAVVPLVLQLTDPYGAATKLSNFVVRGRSVIIPLPMEFGQGTNVLSWRVISADGHPVGGTLAFSVERASIDGGPRVQIESDLSTRAAIWISNVVMSAALFLGIGTAFFVGWVVGACSFPRYVVVAATAVIGLSLLVTPLTVGLQGLDALGAPLSAFGWPIVWKTGYASSYGTSAAIMELALLFGLASLQVKYQISRQALSAIALLGIGAAMATSGHASTAKPQTLTIPAVFLHTIAIAFWAGSFLPLFALTTNRNAETKIVLSRFSTIIPFALVPLIAAGLLLAVVQLDHVSALWTTDYGRIFLLKCVALIVLLGLAALNRLVLAPAFGSGEALGVRWLPRSIVSETVVVIAILGIVALWRFAPPPRALVVAAKTPFFTHIHTTKAMADVTINPGNVGTVHATIVLRRPEDEAPLEAKEVTLILSKPGSQIPPLTRHASRAHDGSWRVDDLTIASPGRWQVEVDARTSDVDLAVLSASIEIKP